MYIGYLSKINYNLMVLANFLVSSLRRYNWSPVCVCLFLTLLCHSVGPSFAQTGDELNLVLSPYESLVERYSSRIISFLMCMQYKWLSDCITPIYACVVTNNPFGCISAITCVGLSALRCANTNFVGQILPMHD